MTKKSYKNIVNSLSITNQTHSLFFFFENYMGTIIHSLERHFCREKKRPPLLLPPKAPIELKEQHDQVGSLKMNDWQCPEKRGLGSTGGNH